MQNDKIRGLIGFAVKANKIIFGLDNIITKKSPPFLIVVCNSLAENTLKKTVQFANEKKVALLVSKNTLLEDIVSKKNCKVVGLTDKNMVKGVLDNLNSSYELLKAEKPSNTEGH